VQTRHDHTRVPCRAVYGREVDTVRLQESHELSRPAVTWASARNSFEAGVLYRRGCPSISRVAIAAPRKGSGNSMITKTIGSKADQQAVLDVLKGVYEAWEANDAEAVVADYLDDASVVQPGVYKRNREVTQSSMASGFAGPLKGSRVIDQPHDVRFLNEDTAIVISSGGIVFPGQNAVPSEGTVRATWVLSKRDGRWFVAAYHCSAANSPSGYEAASLVVWEADSCPHRGRTAAASVSSPGYEAQARLTDSRAADVLYWFRHSSSHQTQIPTSGITLERTSR